MKELMALREMLCEELMDFGAKGEMTTGSLDVVDKLAHTVKNLDKIIEKDNEEYSGMYPYYDERSYRGGRSYAPRRDGMGRYSRRRSRNTDMMSELRDLMNKSQDDETRMEFERFISKMEEM